MARKRVIVETMWLRAISFVLLTPPLAMTIAYMVACIFLSTTQGINLGLWENVIALIVLAIAWTIYGTLAVTVRALAIIVESVNDIRNKMQDPIEVSPVKR